MSYSFYSQYGKVSYPFQKSGKSYPIQDTVIQMDIGIEFEELDVDFSLVSNLYFTNFYDDLADDVEEDSSSEILSVSSEILSVSSEILSVSSDDPMEEIEGEWMTV